MFSIVAICTANSGGGVEDDGLNFCITICGTSLIFGSCRLYKNFATVILFQMISPTAIIISAVSTRNVTRKVAAIAPAKFYGIGITYCHIKIITID